MQVRKTRAIGVDCEHRAIARTAVTIRSPIQRFVRQNQSRKGISSVAASSKTIQGREGLCSPPACQYQAEGYQPGQDDDIFRARFHWLIVLLIPICFWARGPVQNSAR